ncbi:hypothetical protein ERO13_1Z049411v2 [Gossypium hirsutum]|nr:hypothetical protein ERO13_1Z049411v2 [Gossypium hirsutum]
MKFILNIFFLLIRGRVVWVLYIYFSPYRTFTRNSSLISGLKSFEKKMQASDRFNINSQLEHLQAKYVGTGHADLNRFEWAVNIQRDSYASYIGITRCWLTSLWLKMNPLEESATTSCR